MAGTKEGGAKTVLTIKSKYGPDYYKRLGKIGGARPTKTPKGFAYAAANGLTWHREAGRKGGHISRRRKHAVQDN